MATSFDATGKGRIRKEEALAYHSSGRKGKVEVIPTKPCGTARELSLAYSPGVAEPCLEIARDEQLSYTYTARGNLVAVISNGTAVLGLGDIGPAAAKPVMEGKGVLFKKFADIDVYDIALRANDVDSFCNTVKALEPTFGGVNLAAVKALEGADVLLGLSGKGLVPPRMVQSMARSPIVFALANPDPEITYPEAKEARDDVIMATGRSDYPNQVNNVLGFPFIFRGALDVRARAITEEMKMAATRALAALAKEQVPDSVSAAYGGQSFTFGADYIIPKPFDSRVLLWVAPAVAQAAVECGTARTKID